ncbi:CHAT domain-containing protein [Micromonospora sp. WMMD882]|uniref:CHAT domain-containing protein n=1 Tax=Micromonospora sp. WMMD882 TaxID=3015151 RepID=UPI00248BE647|nr:CHAT domain-containing protein [Micromonospora sp. WMMD882]WBB80613.1 CHAT domain-containing protein [Micromonospora sp. WMMD882]
MRHRELLARLGVRIAAYIDRRDATLLLDERGVMEADLLAAALPGYDDRARDEAVTVLGQWHACRFHALPEPDDNADFFAAVRWFSQLAPDTRQIPAAWRAPAWLAGSPEELATAAYETQRRLGDADDPWARQRALALWRAAVAAVGAEHPGRADLLAAAGAALLDQAESQPTSAGPELRAEGIALTRAALALVPAGHPGRLPLLGNLASALSDRGGPHDDDLDDVVTALAEAVDPVSPAAAAGRLPRYQLASALLARFDRTRLDADVDAAVRLARQLAEEPTTPDPLRQAARDLLVVTLQTRYEHRLDADDIRAAVAVGRALAADADPADPDRLRILGNLGLACWSAHRRSQEPDLLDEGIRVTRDAARSTPPTHPVRLGLLNNLSQMLRQRAVRTGATEDARAAVEAARAAVAAIPPGHPDHPGFLAMLGATLWASHLGSRDGAELDEAIRAMRQAADTIAPGHPDRGGFLTNLGMALATRAAMTDPPDRADVEGAVAAHREAVRATPARSAERPSRLVNFAISMNGLVDLGYGSAQEEPSAVEEAVDALAEVLDTLPAGRAERAGALMGLGRARWSRFERHRRPEDGQAAVAAWRELAGIPDVAVRVRVTAARRYATAQARMHGPAAALDGYAAAVELLPLLAWRGLNRADRQQNLAAVSGLAAEAAAAAVAADQPERAVELLEQARGVLWTQLLETRTGVSALRAVDPALADEFEQARAALDAPSATVVDAGPGMLTDVVDRRGDGAARFAAVVARIRALPPTAALPRPDRFLRPTSWTELRATVGDRTVVVVTVSHLRADALVISGGTVRAVALPALTEERLTAEVGAYLRLDGDGAAPGRDIVRSRVDPAGPATLAWLWDAVAEPVLDALGHRPEVDVAPRLWWCPTGLLSLLPLHAAGRHDGSGCSVLDRVVSSYVPTLRALGTAPAADTSRPDDGDGMLVVALPDTPGQPSLPAVERERRMLAALLARSAGSEILSGPAATRAAVDRALTRHRRAHVSCHGTQDLADPSRGGLLLHDGLLAVGDLVAADRPAGDWIFLAACKTATGGLGAVDEAITLSAALSYAGWRHVIGTLWTVDDTTAARVAELVYQTYRPDGPVDADTGARALHRALRRLRDERPDRPGLWAPFVHLGA